MAEDTQRTHHLDARAHTHTRTHTETHRNTDRETERHTPTLSERARARARARQTEREAHRGREMERESDLSVAVWGVVKAEDKQRTHHLYARGVKRHDDHRLLRVSAPAVAACRETCVRQWVSGTRGSSASRLVGRDCACTPCEEREGLVAF
eukprot:1365986-Rhodomonas_salina.3